MATGKYDCGPESDRVIAMADRLTARGRDYDIEPIQDDLRRAYLLDRFQNRRIQGARLMLGRHAAQGVEFHDKKVERLAAQTLSDEVYPFDTLQIRILSAEGQ